MSIQASNSQVPMATGTAKGRTRRYLRGAEPAVAAVKEPKEEQLRNSQNLEFVDAVAEVNVQMALENIRSQSKILCEMEKEGEIAIVGGMYDISTGEVTFFD